MDEKSDPHAEQSRAEDAAEKAAAPLRNSSAGVIHKAREVGRDNFPSHLYRLGCDQLSARLPRLPTARKGAS